MDQLPRLPNPVVEGINEGEVVVLAAAPPLNVILLVDDGERVIRAYAAPAIHGFHPVIAGPAIEAERFELKSIMFQMLQTVGQFFGNPSEDPHLHLRYFLEVSDSFNMQEVSKEALRLKLFPYLLSDKTRDWLNSMPAESITSWNDLAEKFFNEIFSPKQECQSDSKAVNERNNHEANDNEAMAALNDQIANLTNMVKNMNTATTSSNSPGLGRKLREPVNQNTSQYQQKVAQQPGLLMPNQQQGTRPAANSSNSMETMMREYMTRNDALIQSQAAVFRNLEVQLGQMANKLKNRPRVQTDKMEHHAEPQLENIEEDTAENMPIDEDKRKRAAEAEPAKEVSIETQVHKKVKVPVEYRSPPLYPQRLQKKTQDLQFDRFLEVLKQLHINIPLVEALEQMPNYVKFLKDILAKKRRLREFEIVALTKECNAILTGKPSKKVGDLGSFAIPVSIEGKNVGNALCDLAASINLMPLSLSKKLIIGKARPTTITLQLADRSITHPEGKIEDVLVQVDKFIFPGDFIILDYEADKEIPIILGRPFLCTGRALIDV
ncbi:uncharacterized protein LOC111024970 [Momordica charantia]|uniref:Uncharacterized protein LOC111024970 n=1 Tax=Momordica charantia TaxID=3673 RepID=A0A6J1DVZ9_MOMCH|nr:uncharacterized protein LOC111024970 [Momordica charantia]